MSELAFIGLDVHAWPVAAGALNAATGEVGSCSAPVPVLVPFLGKDTIGG